MLADARTVAFLATADADRARAFFRDTLGLALTEETGFAMVFDAGGSELRIQKVETVVAAPYTALGWNVASIEATPAELSRRGVGFERYGFIEQDEAGIWQAPSGARVAWFRDPDGHTLSISQQPAGLAAAKDET